ncbi:MAG: maleate cis-trans isomerase family protein [Methyloligellaceae bacterium]
MITPADVRLGMLTPSSNTVLEPMVAQMFRGIPEASVHFSRVRVTEISLQGGALDQFDLDAMLDAAALLADARVHVIGWNATSASWMGFDRDRKFCAEMTKRYDIPATSAVLAVNEILEAIGARRIAMVTPYVDEVQKQILQLYEDAGFSCVAERHSGERVNYAFADIGDDEITRFVREVSEAGPDAIVVMCTNLRAAHLVADLEQEYGIPIIDSIAAFVWKVAGQSGLDPRRLEKWGRIFELAPDQQRKQEHASGGV